MLYLATGTDPTVRLLVASGALGYMVQPGSNLPPAAGVWAFDNGCVMRDPAGGPAPVPNPSWSPDWWLGKLEAYVDAAPRCLFAVLPDVVCDHRATLARSLPWVERVRDLGYRTALALQNGAEHDPAIPWDAIDVAFLAGDDPFKLGPPAHALTAQAHAAGRPVHMGRVNSLKRLRLAHYLGCETVDGTYVSYGPRKNVPRLLRFLDAATAPTLDG